MSPSTTARTDLNGPFGAPNRRGVSSGVLSKSKLKPSNGMSMGSMSRPPILRIALDAGIDTTGPGSGNNYSQKARTGARRSSAYRHRTNSTQGQSPACSRDRWSAWALRIQLARWCPWCQLRVLFAEEWVARRPRFCNAKTQRGPVSGHASVQDCHERGYPLRRHLLRTPGHNNRTTTLIQGLLNVAIVLWSNRIFRFCQILGLRAPEPEQVHDV